MNEFVNTNYMNEIADNIVKLVQNDRKFLYNRCGYAGNA